MPSSIMNRRNTHPICPPVRDRRDRSSPSFGLPQPTADRYLPTAAHNVNANAQPNAKADSAQVQIIFSSGPTKFVPGGTTITIVIAAKAVGDIAGRAILSTRSYRFSGEMTSGGNNGSL